MEVIDIGLNDLETVSLNFNNETSKQSVNFGSGIELLMNDKKKSSSSNSVDLGELDNLENELNELSGANSNTAASTSNGGGETKTLSGFASNLFNLGGFLSPSANDNNSNNASVKVDSLGGTDSNIGQATRESIGNTKTWDGYSKLNEVPVNDYASSSASSAKMNEREKRRKKRLMIKKLEEWHDKGLTKNNSHFNIDSSFEEIEDEYETALEDKRKKDSVKLQGWWFMTFVNSLEYANAVFNPFDLNLDGWGEQVSEDLDSYDEIFSELHDKYKGGKLAPEISLLLRVGFSAAVLNFSNKALSSATPAFNDVIKQSPELMKMFTNATVSSMSQQSPGFAFANNIMQDQSNKPRGPPPPAPIETKSQPATQRPGMLYTETNTPNRPDINASRGSMFREKAVDLNNGYAPVNDKPQQYTVDNDMNDRSSKSVGANANRQWYKNVDDDDTFTATTPIQKTVQKTTPIQPTPPPSTSVQRNEMRGPQSSDIDNILAGLKTKTVNIHETKPVGNNNTTGISSTIIDDDSMISISSLKDLQNTNTPKKSSRRRNISDKNIISLDI